MLVRTLPNKPKNLIEELIKISSFSGSAGKFSATARDGDNYFEYPLVAVPVNAVPVVRK